MPDTVKHSPQMALNVDRQRDGDQVTISFYLPNGVLPFARAEIMLPVIKNLVAQGDWSGAKLVTHYPAGHL